MYVVKLSNGRYLGPSGKYPYVQSHTSKLEDANLYSSQDKAKAVAREGEQVLHVEECLRGQKS